MKIKPDHIKHMRDAIVETCIRLGIERLQAHRAALAACEHVKDPDKRYRWDLFYASGLVSFQCDTLYQYANDEHIDTALRHIVMGSIRS